MYHENLNPLTVKVLVFDEKNTKVIGENDLPFNILDWITDDVKVHFSDEEILKAIYDLDIVYNDIYEIYDMSVSSKYGVVVKPPKTYHYMGLHKEETKTVNYEIIKHSIYTLHVPSKLINNRLVLRLLENRFEFMTSEVFNVVKKVDFDMKPIHSDFVRLSQLPKELRVLTLEELLKLDVYTYVEKKSRFSTYDVNSIYYKSKYEAETNNIHYPTLHMGFETFLNGNWEAIEKETRKYFTDYYSSGDWSGVLRKYPEAANRLQWIDELFTQPDIVQLKEEILKLKK